MDDDLVTMTIAGTIIPEQLLWLHEILQCYWTRLMWDNPDM